MGTVPGTAGAVNSEIEFALTSAHTGTGGNAGLVRIRFQNTGLVTATVKTDRILLGYTVVLTPPTNFSTLSIDSSGRVTLTPSERDSVAAALLDLSNGVETSLTLRQALRLLAAASAGKLSGAATTTIVIRNVGDSKDRITATVDVAGNRSAITTDLT